MENGVLNSWKEIASYTGRGVRTLQRWERELGFPVRRPRGRHRSAVIAIKQEIDLWMSNPHGPDPGQKNHHVNSANQQRLLDNTEALQTRVAKLLRQSKALAERVARTIELGSAVRSSSRLNRTDQKNWASQVREKSHLLKESVARARELGNSLQNSTPPRLTIRAYVPEPSRTAER